MKIIKKDGIFYKWQENNKKVKEYKEPPFMNSLRLRTLKKYPNADIWYSADTTPKRKSLGLEKTHYNDAISISDIKSIDKNTDDYFIIKNFRKKKRSLREAIARKFKNKVNNEQIRNCKNTKCIDNTCFLNDYVDYDGKKGWISGFTGNYVRIRDIKDEYLKNKNKSYSQVSIKKLTLLCHNNTWQYCIVK